MNEFRKIHQYMVFSANTPMQHALAEYLSDERHYRGLARFYEQKRDLILRQLENSYFKPLHTSGSYFVLLDYSALSQNQDVHYAENLTVNYGLATIPVSVFYKHPTDVNLLRLCFAKENTTLEKAALILSGIKP
jgi:methionine aminotransferase